ncbi:MAG: hypothetical protein N2505_04325 [Endomicrobia bacterium]|nr:hypothetical protein [Endomicrobiia bacterium]
MNKKTKFITIFFVFLFIQTQLQPTSIPGWWLLQKNYTAVSDTFLSSSFLEIDTLQMISNNPSSLMFYKGKSGVSFSTEVSMLNILYSGIFYANKLKSVGVFGGVFYNDFGQETVQYIDLGTEKSKNINLQKEMLLVLSLSKLLREKISFSTTLKVAHSAIQEKSAWASTLDLNFLFISLMKNLNLSVAFKNLGFATKFEEETDELPLSFLVASSYLLSIKNFTFEFGLNLPYVINYKFFPSIGLSFIKYPFKISFSYVFNKTDNNFLIGISGTIKNFEISYGLVPNIYIGTSHKIAVGYKF